MKQVDGRQGKAAVYEVATGAAFCEGVFDTVP
jgi:hypothetical protein